MKIVILIICNIGFIVVFYCLIMLRRNEIVYKARTELIKKTGEYNKYYIKQNINIRLPYISDIVSYEKMCWDLSCWTTQGFIDKYWRRIAVKRYEAGISGKNKN